MSLEVLKVIILACMVRTGDGYTAKQVAQIQLDCQEQVMICNKNPSVSFVDCLIKREVK